MKALILAAICTLFSFCLSAQDDDTYSKVKIDLSEHKLSEVTALGLETDHGIHHPYKALINVFDQNELALLDAQGIPYEYLIKDVKAFYKQYGTTDHTAIEINNRNQNCDENPGLQYDYITPENYEYGSMGGYLPYHEVLENLDLMRELYPNLITERMAIGDIKTHQGRSLYYLVISNTPGEVDEAKPQILYNAIHHAREPNALSNLLFYMWYVLENYGKDEEVTHLVDNTSMFFLPVVNPDGYVYNEQTDPSGGGLWRKNRYPNAQGDTVGVDLNRNYGYFWAFDNAGSSNNETAQTYRGPSAFSEPETQAARKLCNDNNFQIALNYHTFGDLLIHPWGYSDQPTDEDITFKSIANVMATENDYLIGTGTETVGYTVNGDSDDWMYGEQLEKNKIYSLTPEIGPAFWPGEGSIDQLNKSSLRQNLNAAHLLNSFGWTKELFPVSTLTNATGTLFFQFEKSGLLNGLINLEVTSPTPGVTVSNNTVTDINLTTGETLDFQIDYTIDTSVPVTEATFIVEMDNGNFKLPISFTKAYDADRAEPDMIINRPLSTIDDFLDQYDASGSTWSITSEDFFSAPFSITDSPNGDYRNNTRNEIHVTQPLLTENVEQAFLKFHTKFEIEDAYDYVQIQVSQDGGDYISLCGELTNPGVDGQPREPLYDGNQNWALETICLNDYLDAAELRFRFTFFSDGGLRQDGFYFDDLTFEIFGENFTSTENVEQSIMMVSPNPSNDFIRISMNPQHFKKNLTYHVYNLAGQKIDSGEINKPEKTIDISQYNEGSYLIQVIEEGQPISRTNFIKQ